ncbi:hypothetical protein O7632_15545 [Solwaraspora sp. WMMD406]|uniref:hypothetical protein n=1 Tax=Solwaraspora sp. WMMD406 TaxID=3016095 RepID=UPI0024163732|nr:hypothetical protein [Solwaraspora sp. WMMD406]MDG4765500.1 hypothetical protein [Solwaraspora sp. WMMD406]
MGGDRPGSGDERRADRQDEPPRLWPLIVTTGTVTVLAVTGVLPRWPGLAHLVAMPPIDLYTDLRLLLTRAPSVPWFAAGLVGAVAVRVGVLALMLGGLTWRRLRLAATIYLAVLPVLLLAAEVTYIAAAVLYSRLFWPGVGVLALVAAIVAPMPWQGSTRLRSAWRRSWRTGLRVWVTIPYVVLLVGVGVLAERYPALTVATVPVSGLLTATAIRLLSRPAPAYPRLRLVAATAAFLVATMVFIATRTVRPTDPAPPRAGSILLMSGINSASGRGTIFGTRTDVLGYTCAQTFYFSYAGTGDGQPQGRATCPIRTGAPYQRSDTQRPFAEQVETFADQVRDLPRPLVVASHSHAVWVAWAALTTDATDRVDTLILIGPFPDSPAHYLPAGRNGPGRVGSDLLRLLVPISDWVDFHFEPDAPAARELLAPANGGAAVLRTSLPPRVRSLAVTSATDLPLMPDGWRLPVTRNACPIREAHPYLPDTPAFYHEVDRFLAGRPGLTCPPWRTWGRPMALPFGVPATG